ncbi:uncharacterized protein LOC141905968 isoform X2 [Tubulanus polymorphus]|uniref:uncharacterized protein LOC141905968 isoform X2 n=1 Tax=Tubulanus polymorphus TaxID=672921 RepID=UPI003DA44E0A
MITIEPINDICKREELKCEMTLGLQDLLKNGQYLPEKVSAVPREILKGFPHNKRVGNYLLGKTIGEGSFAKVKEGMHTLTGEKVAVKVIDKKKAREDSYVRKNLRREGKILQMVRHDNVAQLYEIMETENCYYLVVELCEGGDLMEHICQRKRLEEKEVLRYMKQIISAVDYLHKAGILHRDLKVENLLLGAENNIKIIDFGLSNNVKVTHANDGNCKFEEFCVTQCGSPAYAAPELLGNKKYGPQVDVWSIGVNMYAMLTGNLPFTVHPFNIKQLHNKMIHGDMNPLPELVSKDCKDFVTKLLIPEPEKRMTLKQAMHHPWITEGLNKPMDAAPFPNRLRSEQIDQDLLKHMSGNMDFKISEIIRLVLSNVPHSSTATYLLMHQKLLRYKQEQKSLAENRVAGQLQKDKQQSDENTNPLTIASPRCTAVVPRRRRITRRIPKSNINARTTRLTHHIQNNTVTHSPATNMPKTSENENERENYTKNEVDTTSHDNQQDHLQIPQADGYTAPVDSGISDATRITETIAIKSGDATNNTESAITPLNRSNTDASVAPIKKEIIYPTYQRQKTITAVYSNRAPFTKPGYRPANRELIRTTTPSAGRKLSDTRSEGYHSGNSGNSGENWKAYINKTYIDGPKPEQFARTRTMPLTNNRSKSPSKDDSSAVSRLQIYQSRKSPTRSNTVAAPGKRTLSQSSPFGNKLLQKREVPTTNRISYTNNVKQLVDVASKYPNLNLPSIGPPLVKRTG